MARKFGKKNIVKVDPLSYNIGLFGLSGIGKTTIIFEMLEKLVGSEGYIHLNIGKEEGVSAIQGINYEDVPNWGTFDAVIDDIVDCKDTDYKKLRVVVIDTMDELELLGKKEVIRLHNLKDPKNRTDSYNKAFGGFNRPHDKLDEIVLDNFQKLKDVGVNVIVVGHVKRKTKTDPLTEEQYDIITAKMTDRLFYTIQTKLHILGLGVIDRRIEEEVIGKDFIGNDKTSSKVKSEKRIIKFRDDNFVIESKSRFKNIVSEISFNSDDFIKAITDAISSEFNSKKDMENAKKVQDKELEEKTKSKIEEIKNKNALIEKYGTIENIVNDIKQYYISEVDNDKKNKIKDAVNSSGASKFDDLVGMDYDDVISILNLCK